VSRNKRKLPGVFLRGTTYWISYCGPILSGKRAGQWGEIRESAKTSDERVAIRLRKARLLEAENHRQGIRRFRGPSRDRVTVGDLLANLEADYKTRQLKGRRQAFSHLEHVKLAFSHRRAATVTRADVDAYVLRRREEKVSDTTIDRETELLRAAFNLGERDGAVAFAPKVPRLVRRHANARRGFLDRADVESILGAIPDADFRDYLEWFSWTGMRPGEIASLSWESFDRDTRTLRLHPSDAKIRRGRVVPITGPLVPIMERRQRARRLDCPLVFHHSDGRPFEATSGGLPRRCYEMWNTACQKLKLSVVPYDLRTVVRNLRAAGVPERVIMEITGHRTREMFDRYGIVDERDMRAAFEVTEKYVEGLSRERNVVALGSRVVGEAKPPHD
jgi:integrase